MPEKILSPQSDEDRQLKEELESLVLGLHSQPYHAANNKAALQQIASLIKSATTSMTSVPKPLKFMIPHYKEMKEVHEKLESPELQKFCSDILSVLSMTVSEERECLKYRLTGLREDVGAWGHEYVRHLAGEIAAEWETLMEEDVAKKNELIAEAKLIVPYHMQHNAEAEACDLLMEMEQLQMLTEGDVVDKEAYERVCLYLTSCVPYVPEPENSELLRTALALYRKFSQYPQAMRLALQLHDMALISELFQECPDRLVRMQLAFMLGRQQVFLELPDTMEDCEDLNEILSNANLSNHFVALAREVLIRCMMSATASLGLILLWDVDGGLTKIDKYFYASEDFIKAGALLACGIVSSGVRNECDPALALLTEFCSHKVQVSPWLPDVTRFCSHKVQVSPWLPDVTRFCSHKVQVSPWLPDVTRFCSHKVQ
ncbi:hypothetical protein HAZT_HAZT001318, partial [Hyalella azteca]